MKNVTAMFAASLALCMGIAPVLGGSIWAKATCRRAAIHTDDTARRVGDILTIIIDEHSVIDNETNRNLEKSEERKAATSGTVDLANVLATVGKHIFDLPKVTVDATASSKFDGKATYDTDRAVTDKMTAIVQDVLPNGNLVVLGRRERGIAGDKQTIWVSGIVRPSDVTFANTVQSDLIAEFNIRYTDGVRENRFAKPGWVARVLNALNPF